MSTLRLEPGGLRPAVLAPPISKSDALRALTLAHGLARPELAAFAGGGAGGLPEDVRTLARGLEALRTGGPETRELDCADGGAPFRFLVAQAAITPGARVRFVGTKRLGERPHEPLFDSLRRTLGGAGLTLTSGGAWPVEVRGAARAQQPVFAVDCALSGQFASSLLLAAAVLSAREGRPWAVELRGSAASEGYVALTLRWLEGCGFDVERGPGAQTRVLGHHPPPRWPAVPGDWSSLGYLLLVAWRSGGAVAGVDRRVGHPDAAVLGILEGAGLRVERDAQGRATVSGEPHRGVIATAAETPDLVPTLAVLACVLPAPSEFRAVEILRHKESDRLSGIERLVRAFGAETRRAGDSLFVVPAARRPARFAFDAQGDHRLAMSAATLSVLGGAELTLEGPECVEKSFPGFWDELRRAGVAARPG
ncbi:MAG: 3-phosphoshikimate 1-carboxyvinyltransferase [Myxococcaceae bacterium]